MGRPLHNCHDADSRLFCIKCKTNVFIDKKRSVELEQRLKMGNGEIMLEKWAGEHFETYAEEV